MAKINLLIANAGNYFSDLDIEKIKTAAKDAESYFINEYGFDYDVDIIVTPPTNLLKTIPEDGISGRTYSSRLIAIVLDKSQAEISRDFVFETICHEMAHSLRWEKLPERATTLFEGMIMEGLAVALEEKALEDNRIDSKQLFMKNVQETTSEINEAILAHLRDKLSDTIYDYEPIFFRGDEKLPRWAGYRLGYYFVSRYLDRTGASIAHATTTSYKEFFY